jgi:hypothetical protein
MTRAGRPTEREKGPSDGAEALLGLRYRTRGEAVRHCFNPPPLFAFLTAEPTLDPLAAAADLLDGLLHSARGFLCLLRRVAYLVILPSGDPCPVLLAPAT